MASPHRIAGHHLLITRSVVRVRPLTVNYIAARKLLCIFMVHKVRAKKQQHGDGNPAYAPAVHGSDWHIRWTYKTPAGFRFRATHIKCGTHTCVGVSVHSHAPHRWSLHPACRRYKSCWPRVADDAAAAAFGCVLGVCVCVFKRRLAQNTNEILIEWS